MATVAKPLPCALESPRPKPPVPPKPSRSFTFNSGNSSRERTPISAKPSPPPPEKTPPVGRQATIISQALVLAEEARARKEGGSESSSPSRGGTLVAAPSNETLKNQEAEKQSSEKKSESGAKVKRSQSTDAKPGTKAPPPVVKRRHSEKGEKPPVRSRSKQAVNSGDRLEDNLSAIKDCVCAQWSTFVLKTKAGGAYIERGIRRKFFKKPPPPPPALQEGRPPAELPAHIEEETIQSRPHVPPRPILQQILKGIADGEEGVWKCLDHVKYIDEEVSTEDSTDFCDVEWGKALQLECNDDEIVYYTYIEEAPDEKVIFYKRVKRPQDPADTEDGSELINHIAVVENMQVDPSKYSAPKAQAEIVVNGKMKAEEEDTQYEEMSPIEPIPAPVKVEQTEVEIHREEEPETNKIVELKTVEEETETAQQLSEEVANDKEVPGDQVVNETKEEIQEEVRIEEELKADDQPPKVEAESSAEEPQAELPKENEAPASVSESTDTKAVEQKQEPPTISEANDVIAMEQKQDSTAVAESNDVEAIEQKQEPAAVIQVPTVPVRPPLPKIKKPVEEVKPVDETKLVEETKPIESQEKITEEPKVIAKLEKEKESDELTTIQLTPATTSPSVASVSTPARPPPPKIKLDVKDGGELVAEKTEPETSMENEKKDELAQPQPKGTPKYASVQKQPPPPPPEPLRKQLEKQGEKVPLSKQISLNEGYYDLDVPAPKPKVKPERPPLPLKKPPLRPAPPVPPKTYMSLMFPPARRSTPEKKDDSEAKTEETLAINASEPSEKKLEEPKATDVVQVSETISSTEEKKTEIESEIISLESAENQQLKTNEALQETTAEEVKPTDDSQQPSNDDQFSEKNQNLQENIKEVTEETKVQKNDVSNENFSIINSVSPETSNLQVTEEKDVFLAANVNCLEPETVSTVEVVLDEICEHRSTCAESELDDKHSGPIGRRSISIPHSVTSESGIHSPTPPPRSHKKRFRSAEGSRNGHRDYESIGKRSRSCSDAEDIKDSPVPTRKEMRDASTNTLPERPPKPVIKVKPLRPPKPVTTLIELAQVGEQIVESNGEPGPDLNGRSPSLKRTNLTPNGSIPNLNVGSSSGKPVGRRPLPPPPAPPRSRTPRPTPTPSPIPPPLSSETPSGREEHLTPHNSTATLQLSENGSVPRDKVAEIPPRPQPPRSEIGTNTTSELFDKLPQIDASRINVMEIQVQRINVGAIDASVLNVSGLSIGDSFPVPFSVSPAMQKKSTHVSSETASPKECESRVPECSPADSLCSPPDSSCIDKACLDVKTDSEHTCIDLENNNNVIESSTGKSEIIEKVEPVTSSVENTIISNEIFSDKIESSSNLETVGEITTDQTALCQNENLIDIETTDVDMCDLVALDDNQNLPLISEATAVMIDEIVLDHNENLPITSEVINAILHDDIVLDNNENLQVISEADTILISTQVVAENIENPHVVEAYDTVTCTENASGEIESSPVILEAVDAVHSDKNNAIESTTVILEIAETAPNNQSSSYKIEDSLSASEPVIEGAEAINDVNKNEEKKEMEKEPREDEVEQKEDEDDEKKRKDKKDKKDKDGKGDGSQGGSGNNKEGDGGGGGDGGDRRDEGFGDDFDPDSEPPDWWKNAAPPPDNNSQQPPGQMTGNLGEANLGIQEEKSKSPTSKKYKMIDKLVISPIPVPGGLGSSIFYTGGAMRHRKSSPSLSEKSSSSSSSGSRPTGARRTASEKKPRRSSWYDADDHSGQSGDVDTSDGHAGVENPRRVSLPDDQSGVTQPNAPSPTDSDVEGVSQVRKKILDLFGLRDRKKASRLPQGCHEGSPSSSSSTTDSEFADNPNWVRVLPLPAHPNISSSSSSLSHSEPEPFTEPRRDANANYCVNIDELSSSAGYKILSKVGARPLTLEKNTKLPNGDLSNSAVTILCNGNVVTENSEQLCKNPGSGVCDGAQKVTLRPKSEGSAPLDPTKRLTNCSTISATSEDSWYNCTSGDESDTECFMTSHSCVEDQVDSSNETKLFKIAEEIMTSEQVFVSVLKLINEDFRNAVQKANERHEQNVIPVDVLDSILCPLPQLQKFNEVLLQDLKIRIKNWADTRKIADIIAKKGPFLKLYTAYITQYESIVASFDEACQKYPAFEQVVKEFEASEKCKNLALRHYMLKPIQRIPQYRLLLETYLKHLDVESPDYQDTIAALAIVSDVANHANQSMKEGDNFAKLLRIQNNLSDEYEIIKPGRVFLKEGELLKASRKGMQPRWFILFNDSLLYTDKSQQGYYNLHYELPLTGMKVLLSTNEEFQNEFNIISTKRSFTLSARSSEERDKWINALNKAIQEINAKKTTFDKVKSSLSDEPLLQAALGTEAPVWIPDSRVTMCQLCTEEFTVILRRHHCRACGKVVCAKCSAKRAPLQYMKNQSARVCDQCAIKLTTELETTESDGSTEKASEECTPPSSGSNIKDKQRRKEGAKKKRPKVLKEVVASEQNVTVSGYLKKRERKSWKKLWFLIQDKVLYTYKASEDVAALESIPLLGFDVQSYSELGLDPALAFQLIHSSHSPMIFLADNTSSAERWIKAMKAATVFE